MHNANKFKGINAENWCRSTLTGHYFKNNPRHTNETLESQFSSVNCFMTFGYHNSMPASSFGTTLQNSAVKDVHIKSCKLNTCCASHVPTDKHHYTEDKTRVRKPQVTCVIFPNLECVPGGSFIGDCKECSDSLHHLPSALSTL